MSTKVLNALKRVESVTNDFDEFISYDEWIIMV